MCHNSPAMSVRPSTKVRLSQMTLMKSLHLRTNFQEIQETAET